MAKATQASPKELFRVAQQKKRIGRDRVASYYLRQAADQLVASGETDSKLLAEVCLAMMSVHFDRAQVNRRPRRDLVKAVAWYDRAIEVYRERNDDRDLSANLTNMSALLMRAGMLDRAVEASKEGLEIAEALDDPHGTFRVAAWNHYAGYCLLAGKLDEAEKTLKRGLAVLGERPDAVYLKETLAQVYDARATELRKQSGAGIIRHALLSES